MTSEFSQIELKHFPSNFCFYAICTYFLSFPLFPMGNMVPGKQLLRPYEIERARWEEKVFSICLSTEIEIQLKISRFSIDGNKICTEANIGLAAWYVLYALLRVH